MNIDIKKVLFRKATVEDAREIKLFANEVIIKNYTSFLGADNTKAYVESGESDKEIDNNIQDTVIAIYHGEIVGVAILLEDLLHLIMIKHSYQGYGLGGAFLKHVEEELFKNYKTIRLETFDGNIATIEFYKKHGWKIVEKEENEFTGGYTFKYEKER